MSKRPDTLTGQAEGKLAQGEVRLVSGVLYRRLCSLEYFGHGTTYWNTAAFLRLSFKGSVARVGCVRLNIAMRLEMMTLARWTGRLSMLLLLSSGACLAQQQLSVEMYKVSEAGIGDKIGVITITEGNSGATFMVAVAGIPAGAHGFHIHEKGDCATALKDGKPEAAGAAGSHYDPYAKNAHKGPSGGGHAGDLPLLTANATGINHAVEAPGLKVADIRGRALVIHESGDNYTDSPENGGSKSRIACGVVPKG